MRWSWKESVCAAKLLVALILAVLSMLYGDIVLLYSRVFCLCLGCMGDIFLGSMVNSPLLCSMVISPLSLGVYLGCWGSLGLSAGCLLGLDLSGCAGFACGESFSPSMADFFSEMKLKASFSAISWFAVLVLIQSSKGLKEINFLLLSSMVLKETLLVPIFWLCLILC